jgi:hypothetical protein
MEASIVDALKKIGQTDCTIHRVTTVIFGIIGVIIFAMSYQSIQKNPDSEPLAPEKIAYMGSGLCIIYCIITFIVLSTDWGCAVVAIRNAARLL